MPQRSRKAEQLDSHTSLTGGWTSVLKGFAQVTGGQYTRQGLTRGNARSRTGAWRCLPLAASSTSSCCPRPRRWPSRRPRASPCSTSPRCSPSTRRCKVLEASGACSVAGTAAPPGRPAALHSGVWLLSVAGAGLARSWLSSRECGCERCCVLPGVKRATVAGVSGHQEARDTSSPPPSD